MHRIARNNIAIESNYLGELNHNCQYCSAKKFLNETPFLCCHSGKVVLAPLSLYPPLLTGLMTGNHVDHAVNQNFFKIFLIVFIACLIFFYLSLAAASSVTSSKSWEDFRKYRSQHPGPLSMRAFHRWCLYRDDHPSFRWRDGTPYNTGNRADAGRRRQRGSKVVNNFFTF
nr:uncharacterized protein LOC124806376 isoform X2 [Hydra vulgaris]